MKKRFYFLLLLFISHPAQPNPILENSIWGREAANAGINVATFYGMAVQESGMHWDDGTFRPWPWTLNINQNNQGVKSGPRRYASKQDAEKELIDLISRGVRNIDVGIMQVNLLWHGDKVSSELELLDPKTNITIAANYLKDLNRKNSTEKTVANYHAPSDIKRGEAYLNHIKHYERIINESP